MQRYVIDTGTYGNGYSAEPDEDGQFVYADDAEACIAAIESQLAQYRWRRVEEEMPENGDYVLVLHFRSPVPAHIAYHLRSGWTWAESGDPMLVDPHYWMPLPPAPEEGK